MTIYAWFLLLLGPGLVTGLKCYSCFSTWGDAEANPFNFKFENVSCSANIPPRDCNGTCYTYKMSTAAGGHHHGCNPGQFIPVRYGDCIVGKTDRMIGTYVICSCKVDGCNHVDNHIYDWQANFTSSAPGNLYPPKTSFIFQYTFYATCALTLLTLLP